MTADAHTDLYARISGLPVVVDDYVLEPLERDTSSGFVRYSTVIRLRGGRHEGVGEDVWTETDDQLAFQAAGPVLDLAGRWSLDSLSQRLGAPDLFPTATSAIGPLFRRWGFESAVLDLALRQAGTSLAAALDRRARPVRYVLSMRLGAPSSIEPLQERLSAYPDLEFKLDPTNDWDDALVDEIAHRAGDQVAVLDFKSLYHGSPVDVKTDPALYARCLRAFPHALLEDPDLGPTTAELVRPHLDRVTWDAPLHSLADVTSLAHTPRVINIKPCRFGSLRELFSVYEHCERAGIGMYGGGFFELGPGRGQIQYLASLFHPDGSNDVAPRGFHWNHPSPSIPPSPLPVAAAATGFTWADPDPPPVSTSS
jgi:L-alanine-DL-glutamate epimerase-like enolase superfamily enzyme